DFKNHLSHNEESLGDDASKQGRIDIGDIDTDEEITLIDETQGRINDIVADEDITLEIAVLIGLDFDLTIKVYNESRNDWLIDFEKTIEANIGEHSLNAIGFEVELIHDSTLVNAMVFDWFIKLSNDWRESRYFEYFRDIGFSAGGIGFCGFGDGVSSHSSRERRKDESGVFGNQFCRRKGCLAF
ncbi:hypothetical protein Tco_0915100, partial [Tanacetum coccineum]